MRVRVDPGDLPQAVDWPEVLQSHVRDNCLRLEATGSRLEGDVLWMGFVGLTFVAGAMFMVVELLRGVVGSPWVGSVGSVVALLAGRIMIYPAAYSFWGKLELARVRDGWRITRCLWWWRKSFVIRMAEIHGAVVCGVASGWDGGVTTSDAAWVAVDLRQPMGRDAVTVGIGAYLGLSYDLLHGIAQVLDTSADRTKASGTSPEPGAETRTS